jgi:hypothetical protein
MGGPSNNLHERNLNERAKLRGFGIMTIQSVRDRTFSVPEACILKLPAELRKGAGIVKVSHKLQAAR